MVTCPQNWATSAFSDYSYAIIWHKLAETNTQWAWPQDGISVVDPISGATHPAAYVANDLQFLLTARTLFSWARIQRIDVNIEWLGAVEQREYLQDENAPGAGISTYREMVYNKHGTTLFVKMCHERVQRQMRDGQDRDALPLDFALGNQVVPVLYEPDRETTLSGNGTTSLPNLATPGTCKKVRFTPERRFAHLAWKPLSRADKAQAVFDLQKCGQPTQYDDDQRCGGLWLAQERPLNAVTQWATAAGNVGVNTCDHFRLTYKFTWKLYKRAPRLLQPAQP